MKKAKFTGHKLRGTFVVGGAMNSLETHEDVRKLETMLSAKSSRPAKRKKPEEIIVVETRVISKDGKMSLRELESKPNE